MAEMMNHIHSANLSDRLDLTDKPAELQSLAKTFNEMLDRLRRSFDQLTQFSSNIAHELRTPLNNLRGEVEVAIAQNRTTAEYREASSSCLEECNRLAILVDRMLFLARAFNVAVYREKLSLKDELRTVVDFYETSAIEAGVKLELSIEDEVVIEVDRTLLQRAVGNLISNALSHTGVNGSVSVRGFTEDKSVVVEVSDTGWGIKEDVLPHVFDRFIAATTLARRRRAASDSDWRLSRAFANYTAARSRCKAKKDTVLVFNFAFQRCCGVLLEDDTAVICASSWRHLLLIHLLASLRISG